MQGKKAYITGGASGIGRATALVFAREGAKVIVADVAEEGGEDTVRIIKEKGGDPHIGRKLRLLFVRAGLETKVGIGNTRIWDCEEDKAYYLHARDFYVKALKEASLSQKEIDKWEYDYLKSLDEGIQLNFFPQFYAIGKK